MTSNGFHNKYRPTSLNRCLGNAAVVAKLKGIISSGSFPSAILFTAAPGAGKTTIARAFMNDVIGDANLVAENCTEINFGANRSIEEVRELTQLSRLRPAHGAKRRFILADEVHQLLANKPAADAFLKPLEEPVPTTIFLLCSMDPEKFSSSVTGRAFASRCLNIQLKKPDREDMVKQAKRILKAEKMTYVDQDILDKVVDTSESSFRVLANNLESLSLLYAGLDEKPDVLSIEDVEASLSLDAASEDVIAVRFMVSLYAANYVAAHKEILNVTDAFGFITKCLWLNWFVHNQVVLKEARHPKVWGNKSSFALWKQCKEMWNEFDRSTQLLYTGAVQQGLVQLKLGAGAFAIDERIAISTTAYSLVQQLKGFHK